MSDEIQIGPNSCHYCGGEYGEHAGDCRSPEQRSLRRKEGDVQMNIASDRNKSSLTSPEPTPSPSRGDKTIDEIAELLSAKLYTDVGVVDAVKFHNKTTPLIKSAILEATEKLRAELEQTKSSLSQREEQLMCALDGLQSWKSVAQKDDSKELLDWLEEALKKHESEWTWIDTMDVHPHLTLRDAIRSAMNAEKKEK